jgi:hypothetical protein
MLSIATIKSSQAITPSARARHTTTGFTGGDAYIPAKRCAVVGRVVRKNRGTTFVLGVKTSSGYDEYVVHAYGEAAEMLPLVPSGTTVLLTGSAQSTDHGVVLAARTIEILPDFVEHIEPPTF